MKTSEANIRKTPASTDPTHQLMAEGNSMAPPAFQLQAGAEGGPGWGHSGGGQVMQKKDDKPNANNPDNEESIHAERIAMAQEAQKDPKLLTAFAAKFPDSAAMIKTSPSAMKLVKEASAIGVEFGGFAEDGPAKNAWPYTVGNKVYVPKAQKDKVIAMSDFIFELNNAIHKGAFAKIHAEAAKGSKGSLDAKAYAKKMVAVEVDGMLRTGEVWFETKKKLNDDPLYNKYDGDFFLAEYKSYKEGKKTKDDIVKDVLSRVYTAGAHKGKTVEQYYMEQYKDVSGGK